MSEIINDSIGGLISKTKWYINTITNKFFKEKGIRITVEQWVLLLIINKSPGITQTEIAKSAQKDKTNITRMLDVLEREKHIERKNDPDDRRVYKIFLTDKGRKVLKETMPIIKEINKIFVKNLNDNEVETLKDNLKTVCNNMKVILGE